MHAWIGFFFSCVMICLAAAGKSGYSILPDIVGGTPNTELMFFIGCAGFASALAQLAPAHSSGRLASTWSAGALFAVTIALNMGGLLGQKETAVAPEPNVSVELPEQEKEEKEVSRVTVKLKRTLSGNDWAPFKDFDYRVRSIERAQEPQPEGSEADPANLPAR